MRATASELLSFTFKGWGACSEQWNGHHDRENDSRIGRGSDCHRRNNDECIRSTKKDHSINTKAVVRDVDRGYSELGAANRASVRTSWWASWPSHHQAAPNDSREVANGRSTLNRWRHEYPEFGEAVKAGRAAAQQGRP